MNKKSYYVNEAIYQASTICFDKMEDIKEAKRVYARSGTETNDALEKKIAELENGYNSILLPSGGSAVSTCLLSLLKTGDHIILSDALYGPTYDFANHILKKYNVEVSYFDCMEGKNINDLVQDNTKVIYLETPASITYEIQDLAEIVEIAKKNNIITVIDNSYGISLFKPLDLGIDISLISLSKYVSGHSDIISGAITINNKELYHKFYQEAYYFCNRLSPQDCYLILRGIKTLKLRLKEHQENTLIIAKFLEERKDIEKVIYPLLDSFPQKEKYQKYFNNKATGLITISFKKDISIKQIEKFLDNLTTFPLGFSWGGTNNIAMIYKNLTKKQNEIHNIKKQPLIRLHIGINDVSETQKDLEQALNKLPDS